MTASIVLKLFGTPDVWTASDAKAHTVLAQAKHVAFLAIAAAARRSLVRRERAMGLLWPDLDDDRARNALSKAIHNCRRALGEDALVGRFADEIGLDETKWSVDLWDFDDAIDRGASQEALALYRRGTFLDGLRIPDAASFDHWVDGERERLRRRAIEAATALVNTAERDGDLGSAAAHMRIACELSPFDEQLLRRHLALLDRNADRAGAISAFAEFTERLQRELDVLPSPETMTVSETIRQRKATVASVKPGGASEALTHHVLVASTPEHDLTPGSPRVAPAKAPASGVRRFVAIAGSVLTLVVVLAVVIVKPADATKSGSVVVTPFVNRTGDSTLTQCGEMIADQLSFALINAGVADVADARTRARQGLSVVSPDYSADPERLAALARERGATTIVTGQYYRAGDSLVLYAKISGVNASKEPLRFARESTPLNDPCGALPRLEQRLLGVIASVRDVRMTAATSTETQAPTYAAYSAYVAGLRAVIAWKTDSAVTHFERALALDSNFVAVVPLLTDALGALGRTERADSLLAAYSARRVQFAPFDQAQLDATLASARGNRDAMYDATLRMTRLAPHSPDAQEQLGYAAATTNHFEQAIDAYSRVDFKHGWASEPTFRALNWHGTALHMLGRYADEFALANERSAERPSDDVACGFMLHAMAPRELVDDMTRTMLKCTSPAGVLDSASASRIRLEVGDELRTHGRTAEALRFAEPAVVWSRAKARGTAVDSRWNIQLGMGLLQTGAWAEALAVWEPMARKHSNNEPPRFAANTAIAAAHLGQMALAEEMLARLNKPTALVHFQRARVLAQLNRKSEALSELRQAVAMGVSAVQLAHSNFAFDPLHGMPEYEALMAARK